jgi:hypothetical protein
VCCEGKKKKFRRRENEIEKKEKEKYDFHRVDSVSNVYEFIE